MVRGIDLVDEEDFEDLMIIMEYLGKKGQARQKAAFVSLSIPPLMT
jgi:hypothetical protein